MATKITNKHGLPDVFLNAVNNDSYTAGESDISVTQLIDSPQIRILRKQNNLEEDVMDRLWSLLGQAMHHILERAQTESSKYNTLLSAANILFQEAQSAESLKELQDMFDKFVASQKPGDTDDNMIYERRFYADIEGWKIGGQLDRLNIGTGTIEDYKLCSVYNYIFPEAKKKWSAQQNTYAHILRKNGYEVNEIFIIAIFRDWSRTKAKIQKDYPKQPIVKIPIKVVPHEQMEEYLSKRVNLHKQAELGNVSPCSPKDRWAKADVFALEVPNGKRAIRLCPDELTAKRTFNEMSHKYDGLFIKRRRGENIRCDSYCPVKDFCPQRKELLK